MPALGSEKHPCVVRVHSMEEAASIVAECKSRGWHVIAGVEPDKPRNISDFERLVRHESRRAALRESRRPAMNSLCLCGSGRKYKRCCGKS